MKDIPVQWQQIWSTTTDIILPLPGPGSFSDGECVLHGNAMNFCLTQFQPVSCWTKFYHIGILRVSSCIGVR